MNAYLAQLATGAITALVPYLVKGAESIAGEAGKNLYNWIKSKFTAKGEEGELKSLTEAPDDQKVQGRLEVMLQNMLEENEDWAAELKELVGKAEGELVQQGNAIKIENSKNFIVGPVRANEVHVGDQYINRKHNDDDKK